jgi:hypothetical protein
VLKKAIVIFAIIFAVVANAQVPTQSNETVPRSEAVTKILWISGPSLLVCENSSRGLPSCDTAEMPERLGVVSKIISGNFVPAARASWIAFSNVSTNLCSVDNASVDVHCRTIRVPRYEGIDIDYVGTAGERKEYLSFKFAGGQSSDIPALRAIATHFSLELKAAANYLEVAVKNGHRLIGRDGITLNLAPSTGCGQAEVDCTPVDPDNPVVPTPSIDVPGTLPHDMPDTPSIDVPGTLPHDTPDTPSFPGTTIYVPISYGGDGSVAGNPRCRAACDALYAAAGEKCKNLGSPRAKAICWGAAAVYYGACLATC